jgi:rhamnosyltransferase
MELEKFKPKINDTIIILVLYKKKLNESMSFQALDNIFSNKNISVDLFIYDNSPTAMVQKEKYRSGYFNIIYQHDAANLGLSKAYNEGYKIAKKLNKRWLLLLDQDTYFSEEIFIQYFHSINNNPDIHLFAPILTDQDKIFSPCKYFLKRGFRIKDIKPGIHSLKKVALLNSGMLIAKSAFEECGGYNEKIRLDFADFEFLERFKKYHPDFCLVGYRCKHMFASISDKNQQEIMNRYKYFCHSAVQFSRTGAGYFILMFWTLLRGIKLSLKYKNFIFCLLFFKFFLLKKELSRGLN